MAGPVLARGAPTDWIAAAAPLVVLLLGPRLAGRRAAWQAPLVLGLCAALPAALAWAAVRWL
jgi:hypothetical protein